MLLPLASSVIFVFGALLIRRAADLGVGVWRATFVGNAMSAVFFAPLMLLGGPGQPLSQWWQPVTLAALLVIGQLTSFFAMARGDVTVATPVFGMKTVIVGMLTVVLLGIPLSARLWTAAILSSTSIVLLTLSPGGSRRRIGASLVGGLTAASFFALFDVLVQKWAPRWGAGRLVPMVAILAALMSVAFVPMFSAPLSRIPRAALKPLLGGSVFVSMQAIMLIMSVAVFGDATSVNIVYATRSMWTVVAVWWIGHWFRSTEQGLGLKVLSWRLAGAGLMTVAVVLALT